MIQTRCESRFQRLQHEEKCSLNKEEEEEGLRLMADFQLEVFNKVSVRNTLGYKWFWLISVKSVTFGIKYTKTDSLQVNFTGLQNNQNQKTEMKPTKIIQTEFGSIFQKYSIGLYA